MNNETFWRNIEGEKWLERNSKRHQSDSSHELNHFYDLIDKYNLKTDKILYIGCSDGTKIKSSPYKYTTKGPPIDILSKCIKKKGIKKFMF